MTISRTGWLSVTASALIGTCLAIAPAAAHVRAPLHSGVHSANQVVRVHDWSGERGERWYRPSSRHVDAPFTDVGWRHGRYTAVDAPFASVRVARGHGVWVRAPFVNLYVPR